jgi:hypothetical protein
LRLAHDGHITRPRPPPDATKAPTQVPPADAAGCKQAGAGRIAAHMRILGQGARAVRPGPTPRSFHRTAPSVGLHSEYSVPELQTTLYSVRYVRRHPWAYTPPPGLGTLTF